MQHPNIDPEAARAYLKQLERSLAEAPIEVLEQAMRRQEIEAHNAMIEATKAAKRRMKAHAKVAREIAKGLRGG